MNLATTIEMLYAGGPGSGCRGPNCGRPRQVERALLDAAKEHVARHQPIYQKSLALFNSVVGGMGHVESRLKDPESLVEKLRRKGYGFHQVSDTVGLRLTVGSMRDVNKAVEKVKGAFDITEEEDITANPRPSGYRGVHLQAMVDDKPVEIQIRTQNQSKFADWAHDRLYKGVLGKSKVAMSYAVRVSDALYKRDLGHEALMPPCPPRLRPDDCFT